ncbi:uncharacterized protein K452DRAFT_156624 [Aplosporella prunicola CBS 121167]|uniref:Uncharacterized protein n=1 Tax=Aplosporella prunicola CBS 121167 TaxID=1176127 RepID=A0A6A6BP24_9PEZI|nr:uncharacterized protein K452DRAFT_156624 [Aplosporella prunicola CBS 121167]KAF2144301.1 hypothetical protein K452DRAFT_156624 [Aplosporella prunicola CBS 121167]
MVSVCGFITATSLSILDRDCDLACTNETMGRIRLLLLLLFSTHVRGGFVDGLSPHARDLFEQSMAWMDALYDPAAGYMFDFAQRVQTGLQHDTRASAWHAVGLLARNNGSDVEKAEKVIRNVVGAQFRDPRDQW